MLQENKLIDPLSSPIPRHFSHPENSQKAQKQNYPTTTPTHKFSDHSLNNVYLKQQLQQHYKGIDNKSNMSTLGNFVKFSENNFKDQFETMN